MFIFFFAFGAILGSYANALTFRFGNEKSILKDRRSYCDHCGTVLKWYELIPLVSFLVQLGRCRHCGRSIPMYNLLVELAMGLGFVFAAWHSGIQTVGIPFDSVSWLGFAFGAVAVFSFVFFFAIDWLYMIIPDHVSLPLIGLAYAMNVWINPAQWKIFALAGILGASFFAVQYIVSKGRWVGGGDIRLGALLGVLLGMRGFAVALVIAYVSGMLVALTLLALKKANLKTPVPFGVFLMSGGFVSFFYSQAIVHWYLNDLPIIFSNPLF